eukprot:4708198-Prymnesium_polylepis.1
MAAGGSSMSARSARRPRTAAHGRCGGGTYAISPTRSDNGVSMRQAGSPSVEVPAPHHEARGASGRQCAR